MPKKFIYESTLNPNGQACIPQEVRKFLEFEEKRKAIVVFTVHHDTEMVTIEKKVK